MSTRKVLSFLWFMFGDFVWLGLFWLSVWLTGYYAIGGT